MHVFWYLCTYTHTHTHTNAKGSLPPMKCVKLKLIDLDYHSYLLIENAIKNINETLLVSWTTIDKTIIYLYV